MMPSPLEQVALAMWTQQGNCRKELLSIVGAEFEVR